MCLNFTLPKGVYATMFIREITKISTDFGTQKQLNTLYEAIWNLKEL